MNMRRDKYHISYETDMPVKNRHAYIKYFGFRVAPIFINERFLSLIPSKYITGLGRQIWPDYLKDYNNIPGQFVKIEYSFYYSGTTKTKSLYFIISLKDYPEYYMIIDSIYTRENKPQ